MSDRPMDAFDARLAALMTAYGDRAVTRYDAAAITRVAVTHRGQRRLHLERSVTLPWRAFLVAGALILLAILAALIAGSRHPSPIGDSFASPTALAWSPDGANLAFIVDVADASSDRTSDATKGRRSHPELWVVSGDGGDPRRLAKLDATGQRPMIAWTPDGRSLLVAEAVNGAGVVHGRLLRVGLDGSVSRTLLDTGEATIALRGPSPSGDQLLYLRTAAPATDLFVLDLSSGMSSRLTTSGTVCCSGTWSPDGRWVMYADGVVGGTQGPDAATWVVAADGSSRQRLGPCCDVGWSADGSRAYFGGPDRSLYSAAPDGSDLRVEVEGEGISTWVPSPDGSRVVAATSRGLEIVRPDGTRTSLTSESGDQWPTWSPDGSWIAFTGMRTGVWGLYVIPASGGDARLVAANATAIGDPWRPGAGRIELAVAQDRAIVAISPDRTGVRDLVDRETIAGDPITPAGDAGAPSTVVIGPSGPDRDIYHVPVRGVPGHGIVDVRFENRSQVTWVPWGAAEKDFYCRLISGPAVPGHPCSVAPGAMLSVTPPGFEPGQVDEIDLAPAGTDFREGLPVILDFEAAP